MNYIFGPFEFNSVEKTLKKEGNSIALNGDCYRLLLFLVEAPGQRKSREDIARFVKRLAGDKTWNGEDNDVDTLIYRLRKAIGDSAKDPVYIGTVTKREHPDGGYKFIADPVTSKINPNHDFIPEAEWTEQLNKLQDVTVFGCLYDIPCINIGDEWYSYDEEKYQERVLKAYGELEHIDLQAVVEYVPDSRISPVVFTAKKAKYAVVKTLREDGANPYVLTANAVLVDPERRNILVIIRSDKTHTYRNGIHNAGGAFDVKVDKTLEETVVREIMEELKIDVSVKKGIPMLLSVEESTRFIQFSFLGIEVPKNCNPRPQWSEIKHLLTINFDELAEVLRDGITLSSEETTYDWVPTGKAAVLAWLALGAPGVKPNEKFRGVLPGNLFREILGSELPR